VAFKLAWAVCQRLGDGKKASPQMREFLKSAVVLASIGTVADMVPLLGENRVLVRYGLAALPQRSTLGLRALMRIAELDQKPVLDAEDIGFAIAPRINAAGRLGQARLAVELLTTENEDRATALADYLEQLNKNRRTVERKIFKQAKELVAEHPEWDEHGALVLAHHDWHAGVIGIVASRVAEHFEKPAILISLNPENGCGQGSGRSFAGFDLHRGLCACAPHLQTFGGHAAAAGLRIAAERIDLLREALSQFVVANHRVSPRALELRVDAEVRLADCTPRAVRELERLGPFGQENPRPVFVASRVQVPQPPTKMGEGERHLSLRVAQHGTSLRAVAFGRAEWADEIAGARGPISISFAPSINRFGGRESVELQLIDWQEDSPTGAVAAPAGTAAVS
jgi:single-stranded-DNA-specific exonuclease